MATPDLKATLSNLDIGVGQSWQTKDYVSGTVYQNTYGRSIEVKASVTVIANPGTGTLKVENANPPTVSVANLSSPTVGEVLTIGAIIPPDHYYQFTIRSCANGKTKPVDDPYPR